MLKYVPLLCSLLVLLDYVWIIFSTLLLCPCWIVYTWCIYLSVFVSVECWTCKWYFALSLFACMSKCLFTMWMFIVVTIYSDCSCMVKLCFIIIFILAWSYCASSICILSFSLTMNLMSAFCDIVFRRDLFVWFKSFIDLELGVSEFWQLFPTHIFKSRVCFRVLSHNSQRGRL